MTDNKAIRALGDHYGAARDLLPDAPQEVVVNIAVALARQFMMGEANGKRLAAIRAREIADEFDRSARVLRREKVTV